MNNISRLASFSMFAVAIFFTHTSQAEDIKLVAHLNKGMQLALNQQEARNLFMGGARRYNLIVVALPPEHPTRVVFNTKVIGLTESRIQSYWAQMRFTGRKKPPLKIANETKLLEYLQATPNAVGYISADTPIPEGLKIIFHSSD